VGDDPRFTNIMLVKNQKSHKRSSECCSLCTRVQTQKKKKKNLLIITPATVGEVPSFSLIGCSYGSSAVLLFRHSDGVSCGGSKMLSHGSGWMV
jgi:hypothetical protein